MSLAAVSFSDSVPWTRDESSLGAVPGAHRVMMADITLNITSPWELPVLGPLDIAPEFSLMFIFTAVIIVVAMLLTRSGHANNIVGEMLLSTALVAVMTKLFSAFACTTNGPAYFMDEIPGIACFTAPHLLFVLPAAVLMVLYFGVALEFAVTVKANAANPLQYKWRYAMCTVVFKLLVAFAGVLLGESPHKRCVLLAILLALNGSYLSATIEMMPCRITFINMTKVAALACSTVSVCCAILAVAMHPDIDPTGVNASAIGANATYVACVLVILLTLVCKIYQLANNQDANPPEGYKFGWSRML